MKQIAKLDRAIDGWFAPLVLAVLALAFFLRIWQVNLPEQYIFDEDYHAFTAALMLKDLGLAFEWWHQPFDPNTVAYTYRPPAIEWLHPPLSKYLQAVSIGSFGNNSFAWRFPSVLAGSLLVLMVIVLAKDLTSSKSLALLAGLIVSIEHLLVVQSRIAMTDIFVSLFALVTICCYLKFLQTSQKQKKKSATLDRRQTYWAIATGLALGLAMASKWSGAFLLIGLSTMEVFRYLELKKKSVRLFKQLLLMAVSACLVYLLAFGPMFLAGKTLADFINLHRQIFQYQTSTRVLHPNQSKPWQWLINQKPVWYYYRQLPSGEVFEIIAQGSSPIVQLGTLAVLYTIGYLALASRGDKKNFWQNNQSLLVLLTFILALWLPWLTISRPTFIYHYTPTLPLVIILLVSLPLTLKSPKT